MAKIVCPSQADLHKLASGEMPAPDMEPLFKHLESCVSCLGTLRSMPAADTLLGMLADAKTLSGGPDEEIVSRLIERLSQLPAPAAAIIAFPCSACGKNLKVNGTLAGKKVKCPKCGQAVPVPTNGPTSPAQALGEEKTILPKQDPGETFPKPAGAAENKVEADPKAKEDRRGPVAAEATADDVNEELWDFLAPPERPDEIGRLGPYRILKVLGAGGMGVVFRAEDPHLERAVAVKAMLPSLAASPSAKKRFIREAKAAAAIKHDHIVAIYQVGEDRGAPFLAMEFLDGEPLDQRLHGDGKMPLADVLRIGRQIAAGLAAAHKRGLIHRDIKPPNIWLEADTGRVKILDFGLARSVSDEANLTQQGAIVGTPAYMAPEQATGQKVDARCDLFSLGCVLYRMSAGQAPFRGVDTVSTLVAVATEQPRPPKERNPDVPEALSDLIMQLLAKSPAGRPESAQSVVEALTAIERALPAAAGELTQRPATAAPLSAGRLGRTGGKNKKHLAIGSLAAVLLLLAVVAGVVLFRIRTEQGEFLIETDDDQVAVAIDKQGGLLLIDRGSKQEYRIQARKGKPLPEGEYQLVVTDPKAGLELAGSQTFTMTRKGHTVRVKFEKKEAIAQKPPIDPAKQPADPYRRLALDRLDANQIPKEERFAWQPKELVAVVGTHRQRHWGHCSGMALSPNGRLLASIGAYDGVRLWDPATMNSLGELEIPSGAGISSLAFSPDGQWLAAAGSQKFFLFDCSKSPPRLIHSFGVDGGFNYVGFALGGDALVGGFGSSGKLSLWDPGFNPPKLLATVDGHKGLRQLDVAPGGKLIATAGSDKLIKLWDVSDRKPKEIAALKGHQGDIGSLAFSLDGKLLFSGDDAKMVRVWAVNGSNTKEKSTFTQPEWHVSASPLACDAAGSRLAVGSHSGFTIFALKEGAVEPLYFTSASSSGYITALAFGPTGQTLFVGDGMGVVQRFDVGKKKVTPVNELPLDAMSGWSGRSAISRTGRLAVGHLREVRIWDLNAPAPMLCGKAVIKEERGAISLTADGAFLACNKGGFCQLWDLRGEGAPRLADEFCKGDNFIACQWLPDGKTLAASAQPGSGTGSGSFLLLERDGDKLKERKSFPVAKAGFGMTLSLDSKTLATWGWEGGAGLRLWSLSAGELREKTKLKLHQPHQTWVPSQPQSAALSPNGRMLAFGSWYSLPKLFDVSGDSPREATALEAVFVHSVCFSPDGKTLAGCSHSGGLIFWDPATGKKTREWRLPGLIHGVAFADDGRHLLTINGNGTVYVLRLAGPDGKPAIESAK